MNQYPEFIDPYDRGSSSLFIRAEHLARYLYAAEFVRKRRLNRVLDCACGNGYGSRLMAASAKTVDAVDGNASLIGQCTKECNVIYHQADLNNGLKMFQDGSFDCVACFETLEHIEQEDLLLREFARVLRKGRWLLLSVPKEGFEPVDGDGRPANPWHLRLYTLDILRILLERCGFIVEQALGQPYTNLIRANAESYKRDMGLAYGDIESYFTQSPESLRFFATVWGWPTHEAEEKSNVIFIVCRKV